MARYEIRFKKSVTKDFRKIPSSDVKRILRKIESLAENPRGEGCTKLSGMNRYRIRLGNYRILYLIEDNLLIVQIVKIAHRSIVYRNN